MMAKKLRTSFNQDVSNLKRHLEEKDQTDNDRKKPKT